MIDIAGQVRFTPYPLDMHGWQNVTILQPGEYTLAILGEGTCTLFEVTYVYIPEPTPTQLISGGEPRSQAW